MAEARSRWPHRVRLAAVAVATCLFVPVVAPVATADDPAYGFADGADGEGIPKPWKVLGHPTAGQPNFRVHEDDTHGKVLLLHAKGDQSDGIYRPVEVDLEATPLIQFAWKVDIHPDGQVATDKDDAAVQVNLDFGRRGLRRQVLSYLFDPNATPGRVYDDSSFVAVNRAIVLNSGPEKLGEWISHSRNVVRDFRACYGTDPPKLQNISIFCDSNDSDSEALGYCTQITFLALDADK